MSLIDTYHSAPPAITRGAPFRKEVKMTANEFVTYGCFKDLCENIRFSFMEMESLRDRGLSGTEPWETWKAHAIALANLLSKRFELSGNNELASSILHSAKMGLRFPHIDHYALHAGKTEELAAFLYKNGIREITVEGGWTSFDENLEGFYNQGWQVEGIHYLPERWREYYGGKLRTVHLVRPTLPPKREDWDD